MAAFLAQANSFFEACETGKGSAVCSQFYVPGATFACNAIPDITTLDGYTDWMKGLFGFIPNARYVLDATTSNESSVVFVATFYGTHSGEGGPCPPTGKSMASPYVYWLTFNGDGKITKMVKVWNGPDAFKQVGWA